MVNEPRVGIAVNVFWGASGTGKTRRAWFEAGIGAYEKNCNTKWWDSYKGEDHVIIDEFSGTINITYLLKWLDRYPCHAEMKGSSVALRATKFWITSNVSPVDWYPDAPNAQRDGLLRRLTNTVYFGPGDSWVEPAVVEALNPQP